jgi:hypothetical protein
VVPVTKLLGQTRSVARKEETLTKYKKTSSSSRKIISEERVNEDAKGRKGEAISTP